GTSGRLGEERPEGFVLREALAERIRLVVDLADGLSEAEGLALELDPALLHQVFAVQLVRGEADALLDAATVQMGDHEVSLVRSLGVDAGAGRRGGRRGGTAAGGEQDGDCEEMCAHLVPPAAGVPAAPGRPRRTETPLRCARTGNVLSGRSPGSRIRRRRPPSRDSSQWLSGRPLPLTVARQRGSCTRFPWPERADAILCS